MLLTDNVANEGEAASKDEDYYVLGCITSFACVLGSVTDVALAIAFVSYDVLAYIILVAVTIVDE